MFFFVIIIIMCFYVSIIQLINDRKEFFFFFFFLRPYRIHGQIIIPVIYSETQHDTPSQEELSLKSADHV